EREACPRGAMGTISVEADLCITMSALRGNASQDAPRPLSNVAQMRAQAPAFPRHALDSLNPQSVPFVTLCVTSKQGSDTPVVFY
uniref:hypothetical protein n=1 Tax=Pseudomonas viridiflava TaxID=33069 RepID=UPI001981D65A